MRVAIIKFTHPRKQDVVVADSGERIYSWSEVAQCWYPLPDMVKHHQVTEQLLGDGFTMVSKEIGELHEGSIFKPGVNP